MNDEKGAIKHATDAIGCSANEPLKLSKAHYRCAQAYTQLGKYAHARDALQKAESAAGDDDATVAAIQKERERLARRQEKHVRDRKRTAERMVSGRDEPATGEASGPASGGSGSAARRTLFFTLGAALLVGLLAALAQGVVYVYGSGFSLERSAHG